MARPSYRTDWRIRWKHKNWKCRFSGKKHLEGLFLNCHGQTLGRCRRIGKGSVNRNQMRRANPSEPIDVKIFVINGISRKRRKRTQAHYHSCYQIFNVTLSPLLKKSVWLGRDVRSTIPDRKGRKLNIASSKGHGSPRIQFTAYPANFFFKTNPPTY